MQRLQEEEKHGPLELRELPAKGNEDDDDDDGKWSELNTLQVIVVNKHIFFFAKKLH